MSLASITSIPPLSTVPRQPKIILVGDHESNRSALFNKYIDPNNEDQSQGIPTSVTIQAKKVSIAGQERNVMFFDVASQTAFQKTSTYFSGCSGIMIVYNAALMSSFDNARNIQSVVRLHCPRDTPVVLVGETSDITSPTSRQVLADERKAFATTHQMEFIEASADRNENVNDAFNTLYKGIAAYEYAIEEEIRWAPALAQQACNDLHNLQLAQIPDDINLLITSYISNTTPSIPKPAQPKSKCTIM